jgi:hypothetical protein
MKKFWLISVTVIFLIAILSTSTYAAFGALTTSNSAATSARISTVNVGVYTDSACTKPVSAIVWGTLTAGNSANFTIYVKNTGNTRETLSMTTTAWAPTNVTQYITITWNQNNTALNSNQVAKSILTLIISPLIDSSITTFSNNMTITGTMQ